MAKFTNGIIGRVFRDMKPKQAERDASGTWWYYHTVLGKKLIQRSVLLCGNSEKERIRFFNAQRQKVRFLIEKIDACF